MVLARLSCCFVPGEKLPEVKKEWKRGGESVLSDESSEYWDLDADLQISGVPENIRRLLKKEYRARTIYVSPMPKVRSFEAGGFLESGTDIPLEGESEEPHTLAQPVRRPFRPAIARIPDRRHLQAEQPGLPAAPSLAAEERELIHQYRLHRFRSRSRTSRMPSMGTELTSNNGDALNQSFSYDMDFEEYTYGGLEGDPGGSSMYDSWTMAWLDNLQHEAEDSGGEVEGFQESGVYVSRQPSVHKLVAHHNQVRASSVFSTRSSVNLLVQMQGVFMTQVSI